MTMGDLKDINFLSKPVKDDNQLEATKKDLFPAISPFSPLIYKVLLFVPSSSSYALKSLIIFLI